MHLKIREGSIVTKCCYTALGITIDGRKEILGLWIEEKEGAKTWMNILQELESRGVKDILVACVDGLSGFPEAINAVYPKTRVQRCIVHQIRRTLNGIPWKDRKAVAKDLKRIYTSATEKAGRKALDEVMLTWNKYQIYLSRWDRDWAEISTFYEFGKDMRRLIYTTNPVESLHRQFRKVTKTTSIFPHDTAALKLLWLAQEDITKKWTMTVHDW